MVERDAITQSQSQLLVCLIHFGHFFVSDKYKKNETKVKLYTARFTFNDVAVYTILY